MAQNNAYNDMMKMWSDYKMPTVDYNSFFSAQRRNIEAVSAANQLMSDGLQEVSRRQTELARANVEQVLRAGKDLVANGSPEVNTAKQAELAKSLFETALANLRETSEMLTKSSFEAMDVINKRASQSIEEISSAA